MQGRDGQLSALTGVRGYAALWVMIYHFAGSSGISGNLSLGAIINSGPWAVEIFFVLSGFVLSYVYAPVFHHSDRGAYSSYLMLRLARIYPLHLAVFIVYLCLFLLTQYFGMRINNPANFSYADGLRHLFLLQAWGGGNPISWNPVAWSVSAEWFAYLFIMPLTIMLGRHERPLMFLGVCIVAWLASYIFYATGPDWEYLHLYEHALLRASTDFALGAALYYLWRDRPPGAQASDVLWICALAGILLLVYLPPIFCVLLLPLIGLMILGLAGSGKYANRVFSHRGSIFLGDISYSIYMIHPLFLVGGNLVFDLAGRPQGFWVGVLFFIVQCLLALLASSVTYNLIERPMRRWVRARISLDRHQAVAEKRVMSANPG